MEQDEQGLPTTTTSAEVVVRFLLEGARNLAGKRYLQGPWNPPLSCRSSRGLVKWFAETRVYRVPKTAARGLIGWAESFPVELLREVPTPERVLFLQAQGRRCVSLLPAEAARLVGSDPFSFAVHDLCHVAKFFDPRYHAEQIGFFATLGRAVRRPAWEAFEASLDEGWVRDRRHVGSDMNGSAIFLFAVFKMKLKMAVRRLVARRSGLEPRDSGPLDARELGLYDEVFTDVLDLLDLRGKVRDAARETSARRDSPEAAALLAEHFRGVAVSSLAELAHDPSSSQE